RAAVAIVLGEAIEGSIRMRFAHPPATAAVGHSTLGTVSITSTTTVWRNGGDFGYGTTVNLVFSGEPLYGGNNEVVFYGSEWGGCHTSSLLCPRRAFHYSLPFIAIAIIIAIARAPTLSCHASDFAYLWSSLLT